MKKEYWLVILVLLVVVLAVTRKTLASMDLPTVSTICEWKNGELRTAGDGFSVFNDCPAGASRAIALGTTGSGTGTGVEDDGSNRINIGNVAFISGTFILKNDGTNWYYDNNAKSWFANTKGNLPSGIAIDNIIHWEQGSFLTKDGRYFFYGPDSGWVETQTP